MLIRHAVPTSFNSTPSLVGEGPLSYLFFHPPRCPGAPPVDRGAGPNSGPDCRNPSHFLPDCLAARRARFEWQIPLGAAGFTLP